MMTTDTFTGHKALQLEVPLLFEEGSYEQSGVDMPQPEGLSGKLGDHAADAPVDLPAFSEPGAMRHFVRLSQKNYAIDMGIFPLGSCTMKHNPRLNERVARLPGFADIHPMQPQKTVQGALEVIHQLQDWLCELTAMPAVAMSPKAGAHGELCGMMAIRAAIDARGEAGTRTKVLVPESAHGTNPATAAQCGFTVHKLPSTDDGRVDLAAMTEKLGPEVAAIMVTNPNTCGLFEREIREMADAIHEAGGYFYCDGANFNAIVGKARPGDLGVDAMHINLHKTFSTPHGGGGPGSGPTVLSDALAPYAPIPAVVKKGDAFELVEHKDGDFAESFGRMVAFHGQMGMFVRALTYMLSHGADGLRQVAEDSVLNANYIRVRLAQEMSQGYPGPCMHEALFSDKWLKDTGVGTLDFAKAMIDEGFHPMTMYFPLVVSGAMLIEPTETESKGSLDEFCDSLLGLARAAKSGDKERFEKAPRYAPRTRLDETKAARQPVLKWSRPDPQSMAAE
jgi:glycine dehydrogenase subunit 2